MSEKCSLSYCSYCSICFMYLTIFSRYVLYGGYVTTYRPFEFWILRTVAKLDTTIACQIESMKHCQNDIVNQNDERLFASTTLADVKARVLSRSALLPVAPLSHETPPLTELWPCKPQVEVHATIAYIAHDNHLD